MASNVLTLDRAREIADPDTSALLRELEGRIESVRSEMDRFREDAARFDQLYYPSDISKWGPDLWIQDPSASTQGMSHVSVNTGAVYVDLPSSLQAVDPVENMMATETSDEAREAAAALERAYEAWKQAEDYGLKWHQAVTIKNLYGRTAARPYWDAKKKRVCLEIVNRPQRLWLGYAADSYDELEWAAYLSRMTPNAVRRAYGVQVSSQNIRGFPYPVITGIAADNSDDRSWLSTDDSRIEVWDYWYRHWKDDKLVVCNSVIAGNRVVREEVDYPEYEGEIPFKVLANTFLPNVPNGRSSLYDVEPLIREKYERVTSGSQMIASGTAGDYWQLTGPEAPSRVPPTLQPTRNEIVAPGPGNRIETIVPFIAEFQLEQFLHRVDYEMETITGLNDLLLGHIPASVLGSSRAVNALLAQYELRLSMPRRILYAWRRATWEMVLKVWTYHDKTMKSLVDKGGGYLDIRSPALSPRDELDTATKAANLVNAGLWTQIRGMDAVGVDDPETEQEVIREENTDATLNPAKVQVMAQLLAALQQLGIQPPQNAQAQAQAQAGTAANDLRTALGGATPVNTEGDQALAEQGQLPPGGLSAGATPPAQAAPFAQAQQPQVLQSMIQNGRASGRILSQTQLGRR